MTILDNLGRGGSSRHRPTLVELPPGVEVEEYLESAEAGTRDLIPGAEKRVVRSGRAKGRTPLSVVYLHGFSATHRETAPLSERVAEALGAHLFLARLTGHGRTGEEAMAEVTVDALLRDAAEAMAVGRRLGRRVVLIGTSTGGTLAAWVAARPRWRDALEALVLISPNFGLRDRRAPILGWPGGGLVARLLVGSHYSFEPRSEKEARYWTHRYPVEALVPMARLVRLARRQDWASADVPLLTFYSPEDRFVDPTRIVRVHESFGSSGARKELVVVEGSDDSNRHVLAGDILSPSTTDRVARRIVDFVNTGRGGSP